MSGIGIRSRWYAAILALAIATTGGATIDTRAQATASVPKQKKPHAIWKGVEVFESDASHEGNATEFPGRSRERIVIKFTYIEETDFESHGQLLSHKVSWGAYRERTATGYRTWRCHSAGDVELVGTSPDTVDEKLKVPCEEQQLGNPNTMKMAGPPTDPVRIPKMVSWADLRDGRSYSEEEHWGTGHHTYSVEVKRILPCAEYNAMNPIPGLPPPSELKAGDIQIVPDASSISPDGRTKLHITLTCDAMPVKNATLDLTIEAQANSGGHIHDGDRPRGKLDGIELMGQQPKYEVHTDSEGKVDVIFEPGQDRTFKLGIAGMYKVIAKGQNESEGSAMVTAEVKGLKPADGNGYRIERGNTDTHPKGTYGTEPTLAAMPLLSGDFNAAQVRAINYLTQCKQVAFQPQKLSANDMSLPSGGFFDWRSNWKETHQTHGKGTGVDFNRFGDVHGTFADCVPGYPPVPLQGWLLVALLESGEPKYGHWDEADLNFCSDKKKTDEYNKGKAAKDKVAPKCPPPPLLHLHFTQ